MPDRCRPDGKRQICPGTRARQRLGGTISTPTPCGCIAGCACSPRARLQKTRRVPHARGVAGGGPRSVAWWRRRHSRPWRRRDGRHTDPDRRQRTLFRLTDRGLADIPTPAPPRGPRRARAPEGDRAGGAACAPRRGGSVTARLRPPTANGSHAPGRCGGAPEPGSPPGGRGARPRRGGLPPSCSILRAPNCARRSRRGSSHAADGALEVRRWRRCGWTPRCRVRAHGVPELASHLRGETTLADAGPPDRTGDRPMHQAAGDLVPPPRAGRAGPPIRSMRDLAVQSNFGKKPRFLVFWKHGLTRRTIRPIQCAPRSFPEPRPCPPNPASLEFLRALKDGAW
jgi:hypothetical protein